ncbi:hypothetical protein CYMTET_11862 [Cymbomonas tetramitiformis]|uniref:Uncharacterized protein n=1 Tax=Cymbomonas tetramitiformis TaxID=36881 RepID=A0AAE0GL89_9CHLO|nr:hypothetical protein CYMTET_11862 [Cymbomonas tetramitiformis]
MEKLPNLMQSFLTAEPDSSALTAEEVDANNEALQAMCSQCDMIEITAVLATARATFPNELQDPTCDGAVATIPSIDSVMSLLPIAMGMLCQKNDDDEYCWVDETMPSVLRSAGVLQTASSMMGDTDVLEDPMALIGDLDFEVICTALGEGGCCSGNTLETIKQLLDVSCMSNFAQYIDIIGSFCTRITPVPEVCTGYVPADISSFTCDDQQPDVTIADLVAAARAIKPVEETKYADCTVPAGECPKDECELLLCTAEKP